MKVSKFFNNYKLHKRNFCDFIDFQEISSCLKFIQILSIQLTLKDKQIILLEQNKEDRSWSFF